MAEIKGVIFDKDGTLFDFDATWGVWAAGFLKTLAEGDPLHESALAEAIGYDLSISRFRSDSLVIAGTPGDVAAALVPCLDGWNAADLVDKINRSAADAPLVEAVPLRPFLTALKSSGRALGVVTNDAEAPALAHLKSAGVVEIFDFVAGFDSGFGAKPEPGQLLGFAAQLGLDPGSVLMVGDSTHDLIAGRRAGMATIGVLTGPAGERS